MCARVEEIILRNKKYDGNLGNHGYTVKIFPCGQRKTLKINKAYCIILTLSKGFKKLKS